MTIGDRIKKIRESEGESQRDFSSSIKISQPALAMFENGQREVKDIHIEQICSKYGINETWLRTGDGSMYKEFIEDDELTNSISNVLEDIHCNDSIYTLVKEFLVRYDKLDSQSKNVIKQYIDDGIRGYIQKREEH